MNGDNVGQTETRHGGFTEDASYSFRVKNKSLLFVLLKFKWSCLCYNIVICVFLAVPRLATGSAIKSVDVRKQTQRIEAAEMEITLVR